MTILLLLALAAASVSGENNRTNENPNNSTGAPLWDELISRCSSGPFSCVQDTFTSFLDRSLSGDMNVTRSVSFRRNSNNYSLRTARMAPTPDTEFSNFVDSVEEAEHQVYGGTAEPKTGVKYNVFGLGEVLYNRGISYLMNHDLSLALPEFFGGGTLHFRPKALDEEGALVRIKYDDAEERGSDLQPTGRILLKRIKKFFSKKLLTSFLAALLVIALIKVKLLFFLPIVLGVGTAKKLLLKVLLFIFPALTHLFKLCAYYHHQHVKYHHHHHQVAHHHHHIPVPVTPHGPYHELPEYLEHPPNSIHRNDVQDVDLPAWGIEHDEDEFAAYNTRRKYQSTRFDDLKYQDSLNVAPNIIKPAPPAVQSTNVLALGGVWDPFYSPILNKLDDVFVQLGFHDEGCRERLVCSMYKAPSRFSPHSNLVSAQLSRDPSELQKPGYSNTAVMRFYKYVQAARDGQDMKSCLTLYPSCTIITEK